MDESRTHDSHHFKGTQKVQPDAGAADEDAKKEGRKEAHWTVTRTTTIMRNAFFSISSVPKQLCPSVFHPDLLR